MRFHPALNPNPIATRWCYRPVWATCGERPSHTRLRRVGALDIELADFAEVKKFFAKPLYQAMRPL